MIEESRFAVKSLERWWIKSLGRRAITNHVFIQTQDWRGIFIDNIQVVRDDENS